MTSVSNPGGNPAPAGFEWHLILMAVLTPLTAALAPRALAPLIVVTSLLGLAEFRLRDGRWPAVAGGWLGLFGAFILYAALTAAWAPAPDAVADQVVQFVVLLLLPLLLLGVPSTTTRSRGPGVRPMPPAVLAAMLFLTLAVASRYPLHAAGLEGWSPWPDPTDLNRNLTATVALVWPATLVASRLGQRWLGLLLPAGLVPAVVLGESQSAQFGLAVGLLVFAGAWLVPRTVRLILTVATIIVVAGAVPLARWLPAVGLGLEWLPFSAQHRLEIWRFAADRAAERPFFGWGLEASRRLSGGQITSSVSADVDLLPLHPHNAYLQVWLELGTIGAALTLAACLLMLRASGHLERSAQPAALAAYASVAAMAAVSYGIWQSWWMSCLMLTALLTTAAARVPAARSRP